MPRLKGVPNKLTADVKDKLQLLMDDDGSTVKVPFSLPITFRLE